MISLSLTPTTGAAYRSNKDGDQGVVPVYSTPNVLGAVRSAGNVKLCFCTTSFSKH